MSDESVKAGIDPFGPMDFCTFVYSLGTNVVEQLGAGGEPVSLELARQSIDVLVMLEEKTRGNLEDEEQQLLKGVLYESRLAFIEASKNA